jgi:hypothetical protein
MWSIASVIVRVHFGFLSEWAEDLSCAKIRAR